MDDRLDTTEELVRLAEQIGLLPVGNQDPSAVECYRTASVILGEVALGTGDSEYNVDYRRLPIRTSQPSHSAARSPCRQLRRRPATRR